MRWPRRQIGVAEVVIDAPACSSLDVVVASVAESRPAFLVA
jgi:hypothetical protein